MGRIGSKLTGGFTGADCACVGGTTLGGMFGCATLGIDGVAVPDVPGVDTVVPDGTVTMPDWPGRLPVVTVSPVPETSLTPVAPVKIVPYPVDAGVVLVLSVPVCDVSVDVLLLLPN